MASKSLYAIIAGVGPGTGRSVALRFAQKYPVVLFARRPESYESTVADVEKAGGKAIGITADVADPASLKKAFDDINKQFPNSHLAAAVYNVGSGGFAKKPFLEQTEKDLDASIDGSIRSFFHFAQATIPHLLEAVPESHYPPTLILTGATASIKGSPQFSTFAAGKWGQRAMHQSLAREFGPKGVHVAHAIIDGVIDIPRTKEWAANDGADDGKISPDAIAEAYWNLHTQHRSAFTQEIDIRPYVEKW
ncbi:hypothetical protein QX201_002549 [Fusarium graminearum]|nr:unnamed protein product [Fusarium graminearum]